MEKLEKEHTIYTLTSSGATTTPSNLTMQDDTDDNKNDDKMNPMNPMTRMIMENNVRQMITHSILWLNDSNTLSSGNKFNDDNNVDSNNDMPDSDG